MLSCARQLAFHELCALYAVTDVALVTSLRDGMNLVSYEYVACQSDNAGALHATLPLSLVELRWELVGPSVAGVLMASCSSKAANFACYLCSALALRAGS